jgi:hypothetical protein
MGWSCLLVKEGAKIPQNNGKARVKVPLLFQKIE